MTDDTISKAQVLACPFCGGANIVLTEAWDGDASGLHYVCDYTQSGCGGAGGRRTDEELALAMWNERVATNAKADDVRGEDARDAARYRWVREQLVRVDRFGKDNIWAREALDYNVDAALSDEAALSHRGERDE